MQDGTEVAAGQPLATLLNPSLNLGILTREAAIKVIRRMTKPYTPQTNGMVERFNGRVASEVLGINVAGHRDLDTLLVGFNAAYNRRRQRVLAGLAPADTLHQRLGHNGRLANPGFKPVDPSALMPKVEEILYYVDEVSQPDKLQPATRCLLMTGN